MTASLLCAALVAAGVVLAAPAGRSPAARLPGVLRGAGQGKVRGRRMALGAASLVAGGLLVCSVGALQALLVSAGGVGLWLAAARSRARHVVAARAAGVIEFARALAAELRAGLVIAAAATVAAENAPLVVRDVVLSAVQRADFTDGGGLLAALRSPSTGDGLDGLSKLATCCVAAAVTGAALAPAVDRVADALQDDLELQREVAAALAGPRATVRLLAGLPLLGLVFGAAVGARPLAFLFGGAAGWCCLAGAAAFEAAGVAWSRRIVARVWLA